MYVKDDRVEFMRLQELKEPGVREVFGRGYTWGEEEQEEKEEEEEEEEEDREEEEEEGEEEE